MAGSPGSWVFTGKPNVGKIKLKRVGLRSSGDDSPPCYFCGESTQRIDGATPRPIPDVPVDLRDDWPALCPESTACCGRCNSRILRGAPPPGKKRSASEMENSSGNADVSDATRPDEFSSPPVTPMVEGSGRPASLPNDAPRTNEEAGVVADSASDEARVATRTSCVTVAESPQVEKKDPVRPPPNLSTRVSTGVTVISPHVL